MKQLRDSVGLLGSLLLLLVPNTIAKAISLADFSPRTYGLPSQCEIAYTTQIPGCLSSDFGADKACSSSCLRGLVQINNLINQNCRNADVSETSIIGLFQLGQGIQILCNVAVITQTAGQGSTVAISTAPVTLASIGQSTMVLSSAVAPSTGLLTDSSSSPIQTTSPSSSPSLTASTQSSASAAITLATIGTSTSLSKATTTTVTSSKTSTRTSSTSAKTDAAKSGNTQSGGGSPIDNANNSGAAGSPVKSGFILGFSATLLVGMMSLAV